jgi:site-specific DNA recombinase
MAGNIVDAAAYYRYSDDRQEDSIERQRSQVEPYALKHGYKIVKEYTDEGISGDREQKRKAFMQMIADAPRGDFTVILCDDQDRFGRFDSITQGYYAKILRDARVRLETVAQGKIDWNSFAGRITGAVTQEAKAMEAKATSRRVIGWMLQMARRGKWLGGPVPYGYTLEYDLEDVLTASGIRIQKRVNHRLVPGDPAQVRAVQLMFTLYGERHFTLEQIAEELKQRGVEPPNSANRKIKPAEGRVNWQRTTIRRMLRNRKYVGDMVWNCKTCGGYSEVKGGEVKHHDARVKHQVNDEADWEIVRDVHEGLIERPLFEKVQALLDGNRTRRPGKHGDVPYVLSGLLVCGHCGWQMQGTPCDGHRYYRCGRYHQEGKRGCQAHLTRESLLVDAIVRKLQEAILNPGAVAKLREEIRRQCGESQGHGGQAARLRRQMAELGQKIDKGLENMALVDRDLLADYGAKVRGWKEERERFARELENLERPRERANLEAVLAEVESLLGRLRDVLLAEDPLELRNILLEFVSRVELWWDHDPKKGLMRSHFRRGLIHIRPQQDADLTTCLTCTGVIPTPAR